MLHVVLIKKSEAILSFCLFLLPISYWVMGA